MSLPTTPNSDPSPLLPPPDPPDSTISQMKEDTPHKQSYKDVAEDKLKKNSENYEPIPPYEE